MALKPVNPRRKSVTPAAIQIIVPAGSEIIVRRAPERCVGSRNRPALPGGDALYRLTTCLLTPSLRASSV